MLHGGYVIVLARPELVIVFVMLTQRLVVSRKVAQGSSDGVLFLLVLLELNRCCLLVGSIVAAVGDAKTASTGVLKGGAVGLGLLTIVTERRCSCGIVVSPLLSGGGLLR